MCSYYNADNTQNTRIHPMIYRNTTHRHNIHITLQQHAILTFTDTNTRENLPEVSPKRLGLDHIMTLAGQRQASTLGTQGSADTALRPPYSQYNRTLTRNLNQTQNNRIPNIHIPLDTNILEERIRPLPIILYTLDNTWYDPPSPYVHRPLTSTCTTYQNSNPPNTNDLFPILKTRSPVNESAARPLLHLPT